MVKQSTKETQDITVPIVMGSRSEEVSDIVERMPTAWTYYVVTIIVVILVVFCFFSFAIEYPDTVSGSITITGDYSPVRIVAPTSGRLKLLISNGSKVKEGQHLGYIDNGSDYNDILKAIALCTTDIQRNTKLLLPPNLVLGAVSTKYNEFALAYNTYELIRTSSTRHYIRETLQSQLLATESAHLSLQQEIAYSLEVTENISKRYEADSTLQAMGAISEDELRSRQNTLLEAKLANSTLIATDIAKQIETQQIRTELAKIESEFTEKEEAAFAHLISTFNAFKDELMLWKELYIITAPINGEVEFLGFWHNNMYVSTSKEILAISPSSKLVYGEMTIASLGAGKVRKGQVVNIRLADYPFDEYGFIEGQVEHISNLARNIDTEYDTKKMYLVSVSFPKGMETNYGNKLQLRAEASGTASIVTKKRKIIQRLLDNLKTIDNR